MKTRTVAAILLLLSPACLAQRTTSAGSFARLGFGARGMAMGNALGAVPTGAVSTYYNPALASYSEHRTAAATFSVLGLDRKLNFLSYTQAIHPTGGVSLGLINAGVGKIDGRDGDGVRTEEYSTTEDQFFLTFSNRVADNFSLGVSVKLQYAKLFDQVSTTTVGFDVGAFLQATDQVSFGICIKDLNSKYKWDTSPLYGQDGKTTTDQFPTLRRFSAAVLLPGGNGIVTAEFQNASDHSNQLRFGCEAALTDHFAVRGGVDRFEFGDDATGAKPSFGFSAKDSFHEWVPELTYTFVAEPVSPHGMHVITLSASW